MKATIDDVLDQLIDLAAEAEWQRNAAVSPLARERWQWVLDALGNAYTWLGKIRP